MKWDTPPIIKIYEALGAVADGRVHVSGNTAKVYSSSGNKYYDVSYDSKEGAIMANDNASYWKGYLGYPAIAFLFRIGVLPYREDMAELLKGTAWKDINQRFKNDFRKTIAHIYLERKLSKIQVTELAKYAEEMLQKIQDLHLVHLGKKQVPPKGY